MRHHWGLVGTVVLGALVVWSAGACHRRVPPVETPAPPPPAGAGAQPGLAAPSKPPAPPEPVKEPVVAAPAPIVEDRLSAASLDEINKNSPLKPVFFEYDQSDISGEAQKALDANADVLKRNSSWIVTIEGHCDERGTAEYNLALGERRAGAVKDYLVSLGIAADRITAVSKGKEQPVCTEENESCWAQNRRGHFIIVAK
jgi:peptidoglycan-associated lipoprotein